MATLQRVGPSAARAAGAVYRLGTEWLNWYVVEEDGRLTIVDAGLPGYREQLDEALGALGMRLPMVEAIVLTHGHFDHTGFAARLSREAGVPVLIHSEDVSLAGGPLGLGRAESLPFPYLKHDSARRFIAHCARERGLVPHPVRGPRAFGDGDRLDVPGRPLVIHAPGHTDGSCALHLDRHGLILMGDVLCSRNPLTGGRGPQLLPSAFTRSSEQALASLDRISVLDADTLLFGHGEPFTGAPAEAIARARETGRT